MVLQKYRYIIICKYHISCISFINFFSNKDTVKKKKKSLTKNELLAEYNALKKKYEVVIKENGILQKKLVVFENSETKKEHTYDQVCQTNPDSKQRVSHNTVSTFVFGIFQFPRGVEIPSWTFFNSPFCVDFKIIQFFIIL